MDQAAPELGQVEPNAVLLQGAEQADVSVRARSLELLIAHSPEAGGGVWGPRALYDPNPAVQRAALRSLSHRLAEPESSALVSGLVARTEVDPYMRGAAAVVLALHGDTSSRAVLSQALSLESEHWRAAPLALGAAMMGDQAALERLTADLAIGDMPLELRFFQDCGRSGLPELAPPLVAASERVEEELVLAIGAALLQLGDPEGARIFKGVLGSGDEELVLEALDYLRALPHAVSGGLLSKADSGGPPAGRAYARMIQVSRGELPLKQALDTLDSSDRELRQQAVQALAGALQQDGVSDADRQLGMERLVASLQDPESVVADQAVHTLAQVGRPGDEAVLAGWMTEQPLSVQVEVAGAILAIRERAASGS